MHLGRSKKFALELNNSELKELNLEKAIGV